MKGLFFSSLISVGLLCMGTYLAFTETRSKIHLNWVDLCFVFFLIIGGSSIIGATNQALAIQNLVLWISLFSYILLIRLSYDHFNTSKYESYYIYAASFIFLFLLFIISIVITPDFSETILRNKTGLNSNSASIYLLLFFPFFLQFTTKTSSKFRSTFLFLTILWLIAVCLKLASLGSILITISLLFIYKLDQPTGQNWILKHSGVVYLIIIIIIGLALFLTYDTTVLDSIVYQLKTENDRFAAMLLTLKLVGENPLLGCGIGNWQKEVYQFTISGDLDVNNPSILRRRNAHNSFLKIIGELGFVGLISYCTFIFSPLINYFKNKTQYSIFERACFYGFLVYLLSTTLYSLAVPKEKYNLVLLIAFFYFGVLVKNLPKLFQLKSKWFWTILIALQIFCSITFSTFYYKNKSYKKYQQELTNNPTVVLKKIEKLYQPNWFNYDKDRRSIALYLAVEYSKIQQLDKANFYFKEALKQSPYSIPTLNAYTSFLLQQGKIDLATGILNKSLALHPTYYNTKLLQGEYHLLKNNHLEAVSNLSYFKILKEKNAKRQLKANKKTWSNPLFIKTGHLLHQIDQHFTETIQRKIQQLKDVEPTKRQLQEIQQSIDRMVLALDQIGIDYNKQKYKNFQLQLVTNE